MDAVPSVSPIYDAGLLAETEAILAKLVGFDTISSRSNQALIDWFANRLDDLGIKAFVQHGDEAGKANLYATIGPDDVPGVMLSGHSDVVPVEGQAWTSDPFTLTERDGRWYGRGSADMKAWIACCLANAPRFVAAGLRTPVHLALSYNEETDMHGMAVLTRHLRTVAVRPAVAIIGEPTMMQVVVANKGVAVYRVRTRGKSVHSSLRHKGVSAVELAAEVIAWINARQTRLLDEARHDGFDFPHTGLHVGRIQGGTAPNITAQDCQFTFEIRTLPGVTTASILDELRAWCDGTLLPRFRAIAAEADVTIETALDTPGLDETGNRHLARAVMPLCGCHAPRRVSFGTEGGILQGAGVPTVICGPGDIAVAHQADEYVERSQLDACNRFLHALTGQLQAGRWPAQAG